MHSPPPGDTLVHLVSDQTMQNVLPILALAPRRVVQVLSQNSERFRQASENTKEAVLLARKRGFTVPDEWPGPLVVGSEAPDVVGTKTIIGKLLETSPGAWVNYTGGTKNMSIGAWIAARDNDASALYCDTPREFLPGFPRGPLPAFTLQEVAAKLDVPIILASQGLFEGKHWLRRKIKDTEKRFGETVFKLVQAHGERFRRYRQCLLAHGVSGVNGRASAGDLQRVINTPVPLPPPGIDFSDFFVAAGEAGLLEERSREWFFRIEPVGNASEQRRRLERVAQGLSGTAFEACVAALLDQSSKYSSALSNVYPAGSHPEELGFGESDFLAYEPKTLALTLISCKSSPPGLEHLESLLARKAKFGGLFAKTLLCVEYAANAQREKVLRSQCKSLGIGLAIGEEITEALGA